ncbi:MAG TPA: hypothetical protein VNO50_16330 [Pyrinomonadaceae bacterium]|nr:hypothetical protein [Pyrinomonadaceae bacterium]
MPADTLHEHGSNIGRASAFFRRLEIPADALLAIYVAVFARQYLWFLTSHNRIAWTISALASVALAALYIWTKPREEVTAEPRKLKLPFWVIVVLPLAIVYAMRVVFPDLSFDVLNYRITHAERAMRGFLFLPTDFFPTPAPYNPAPDMVTGIFRHALGYRLGTVANLLVMIWVAKVVEKLLRPFIQNAWLRAAGILVAVSAEHLLFEINNYMADLLALPLLLEATYLALFSDIGGTKRNSVAARNLVCIALLLGMSVAFKLTNASVALPVVLLCAYRALRPRDSDNVAGVSLKQLALTTLLSAVAFLAPLFPFSFYLYRDTGSPVFPVFNGIFKSAFWPPHSIWDPRWGPVEWWETLLWPILISFEPERLSELAAYSGKISLGFVVAIVGLILLRRDTRLREFCLLLTAAALFWSASTGYIRYALYVEVMATVVVLALTVKLIQSTRMLRAKLVLACLLIAGLGFQTLLAFYFVSNQEWSQRPTVFAMPGAFMREARHLFRDHSLRPFLQTETQKQVDDVGVWIGSDVKTNAITVMLRPDVPAIGVNQREFFVTPEARARFKKTLAQAEGKQMFSLAFPENVQKAKLILRDRGLVVVNVTPVEIPYYSPQARIAVALLELKTVKAYKLENEKKLDQTRSPDQKD